MTKQKNVAEAPVAEAPVAEAPVAAELVTVTVPKPFSLNWDHNSSFKFKAGTQEMEKRFAEHWYAKANGVEIYAPKVSSSEQ